MKAKRNMKPLWVTLLVIAALVMLVLCHAAASPRQLLPVGFRYGLYAVSEQSYEASMQPGDLVVCDKNAPLGIGSVVLYRQHWSCSTIFTTQSGAAFGRLLDTGDSAGGIYTVQVNYNGQGHTANSAKPELAIYRIAGLGGMVMGLHANRYLVWGLCGGLTVAFVLYMTLTAKKRRVRRSRENYLRLFDHYAEEYEKDSVDF